MSNASGLLSTLSHYGAAHEKSPATQHGQLVKNARKVISQTFFGTMLKQMRDSPFKSKIFDGGRGGEAFSTMLDQHLSEHMANAKCGTKMVNSMVNHIEANQRKKLNLKEDPKPRKQTAAEALFQRSGYLKKPARDGRKNVPADYRA